jgi:hypothetical protein
MDCSPLLIWKKIWVILRHFLIRIQSKSSPLMLFFTLPLNPSLIRPFANYQWIFTFDPVLFPPKNWKVGITPPDKAGHQTWRSIILWNMTMMSDYWINVYFVLQYLLCLSLVRYFEIVSKSRSAMHSNKKGITSVYLPVSFVSEGKSW